MSLLDFIVLLGSILGIAVYGTWRTRHRDNLKSYFKGDESQGWATIGLSVMATQASAITFMSTPGQGYEDGLGFVQFYFGIPIALVIISAVFLPMYRRFNVYTAYEFLGQRFDGKTRMLGAALFLLQRGLAAGITIYAPAIILSTMLGWPLHLTIVLAGVVAIIYTAVGGSQAVSLTQKYQMGIIFAGMGLALVILLVKLPASLPQALTVAGAFDKLHAVNFSLDVHQRYTLWSGLLGGVFLQLSYFGTDQSQVQRYLTGGSLRESRLGLMFNALCKIPMQFGILFLGVLVFVFYQFEPQPIFFNQAAWQAAVQHDASGKLHALDERYRFLHAQKEHWLNEWLQARREDDRPAQAVARAQAETLNREARAVRTDAKNALRAVNPLTAGKDSDYVFITFILDHLPHGIIGLLIAAFFAAALSSKAAELNALASTTTIDFYQHLVRPEASGAHYVAASKWFTIFWGLVALAFALFASLADNLIQAINIIGSLFYGVVLGLFLVAFFLRRVGGTAVFWAAVVAELLVLGFHFFASISYLWYNLIGCVACAGFSLILQALMGFNPPPGAALDAPSAAARAGALK